MLKSSLNEFKRSAANVDECTPAVMLWYTDAKSEMHGVVLGDTEELMRMYRSIFLGLLPLAGERGWL